MTLLKSAKGFSAEARKGMAVLAVAALAVIVMVYLLLAWHTAAAERLRQAEAEHAMVAARAAKAAASRPNCRSGLTVAGVWLAVGAVRKRISSTSRATDPALEG